MKLRFRVGRKEGRKEGSKQARKNGDIEALADAMRALKKKKTITAMPNLFPLIISFNWIS